MQEGRMPDVGAGGKEVKCREQGGRRLNAGRKDA